MQTALCANCRTKNEISLIHVRYMQHQTAIISVEKIMSRIENKSARSAQIEALLLAYPQGLTQAELARRPDIHRSAISRNLLDTSVLFFQKLAGA